MHSGSRESASKHGGFWQATISNQGPVTSIVPAGRFAPPSSGPATLMAPFSIVSAAAFGAPGPAQPLPFACTPDTNRVIPPEDAYRPSAPGAASVDIASTPAPRLL